MEFEAGFVGSGNYLEALGERKLLRIGCGNVNVLGTWNTIEQFFPTECEMSFVFALRQRWNKEDARSFPLWIRKGNVLSTYCTKKEKLTIG